MGNNSSAGKGKRLAAWVAAMLMALSPALNPVRAQYYQTEDTVTEYPNKGTFYHDRFVGRKTASGEVFDQNKFTAAHWRIKLGTYVMVTNQNTGLQVIVRVNDRCPKRGVFDMSHRAAAAIGIRGMQPVTIRLLPDGYEERWAAQESLFDSVGWKTYSGTGTTAQPNKQEEEVPVYKDAARPEGATYGLLLGEAASHSEVYTLTQRLPAAYRDRVGIEPLEGSDSLRMTLDVRLARKEAEQLARSLRKHFPSVKVTATE